MIKKENAICAIFDDELNLLFQLRSNDAPILPGYLGLFGGGIENNEEPDTAIQREIKEEIEYTGQFNFYKIRYAKIGNWYKEKSYIFINKFIGNKEAIDIKEGEKALWLNLGQLSKSNYKIMDHDFILVEEIITQLKLKAYYEN